MRKDLSTFANTGYLKKLDLSLFLCFYQGSYSKISLPNKILYLKYYRQYKYCKLNWLRDSLKSCEGIFWQNSSNNARAVVLLRDNMHRSFPCGEFSWVSIFNFSFHINFFLPGLNPWWHISVIIESKTFLKYYVAAIENRLKLSGVLLSKSF